MRGMLFSMRRGVVLVSLCGAAASGVQAEEAMLLSWETEGLELHRPALPLFGSAALDEAALSGQRGGTDAHLSKIVASGSVNDVWASDLTTGHNIITEGAFTNAAGIPMSIQNSGNGVLIQNAVIVNVDMR